MSLIQRLRRAQTEWPLNPDGSDGWVELVKAAADALERTEAVLREMTSNEVHDALCQAFEDWENAHTAFNRAKALVEELAEGDEPPRQ